MVAQIPKSIFNLFSLVLNSSKITVVQIELALKFGD